MKFLPSYRPQIFYKFKINYFKIFRSPLTTNKMAERKAAKQTSNDEPLRPEKSESAADYLGT